MSRAGAQVARVSRAGTAQAVRATTGLAVRSTARLDTPSRLARAVDLLPGSWGRAASQRLEVLAEALAPGTAPTTAARVEAVLAGLDGRPHWGKRHYRTAAELRELYPDWARFAEVRDRLDPRRVFANDYTDRVLGP